MDLTGGVRCPGVRYGVQMSGPVIQNMEALLYHDKIMVYLTKI